MPEAGESLRRFIHLIHYLWGEIVVILIIQSILVIQWAFYVNSVSRTSAFSCQEQMAVVLKVESFHLGPEITLVE